MKIKEYENLDYANVNNNNDIVSSDISFTNIIYTEGDYENISIPIPT